MKNLIHILIFFFFANIFVAKGLALNNSKELHKQANSFNCSNTTEGEKGFYLNSFDNDPLDDFEYQNTEHDFGLFTKYSAKSKILKFYWWGTTKINPLTIDIPPPFNAD